MDLLTSESFQKKSKSVFCDLIQKELIKAAEKGKVHKIKRVLSNFMVDKNFMSGFPLLLASENGHKHVVQLLLDRGAEPNIADTEGYTSLHLAALNGHNDVVLLLLDRGAEPNMINEDGVTPLIFASRYGNTEVVQFLLDRKADPNVSDQEGYTPLHIAVKKR